MDIGSLLLILALLIPVVIFIARPFFDSGLGKLEGLTQMEDHDLSGLLAERDRILTALQELEFDQALGKIPAEDYPAQRAMLVQRGADVLRSLDLLQSTEQEHIDAVERVEAVVAKQRADAARPSRTGTTAAASDGAQVAAVNVADDALEVALAQRRRQRQEKSAGFCPQCGGPVQKSDRFCPKCGAVLSN